MKQVLPSSAYSFNATAKTITIPSLATIDLGRLLVISNDTVGVPMYVFGDATASTATVAGSVITLSVVPVGSSNTDALTVIYDWQPSVDGQPPSLDVTGLSDGARMAVIKAASTPPLATDPALVVALSPNTPFTVGLTDAQLRATAVPVTVSGVATAAKQPALGTAGVASADVISVQGITGGSALSVTAAALPLPTGAATEAKQAAPGAAGAPGSQVVTVQGITGMTALKVDPSGGTTNITQVNSTAIAAGAGATTAGTLRTVPATDGVQAVSASALPLPAGAATALKQPGFGVAGTASADVVTVQGIASGTPLAVAQAFDMGTGTTGSLTQRVAIASDSMPASAQGAAAVVANAWPTKISDGTNVAAVKAASTLALATDTAVVVAVRDAVAARVGDGVSNVTIKPASTAPLATDTALVVTNRDTTIKAASTPPVATDTALVVALRDAARIGDGTNVATVKAGSTAPAATDTALVVAVRDTTIKAASTPPVATDTALVVTMRDALQVSGAAGTLTNASTSIVTGGAAQELLPANASRKYLMISFPLSATGTLFVRFGGVASGTNMSIDLSPGGSLIFDQYVTTDAVSVYHATTGAPITCYWGA